MNHLVQSASLGSKAENEDNTATSCMKEYRISVVADGLGSYRDSHVASKFVCEEALALIKKDIDLDREINFKTLFQNIAYQLDLKFDEDSVLENYLPSEIALGTTLLVCVEDDTSYRIGYIGNGGIFHLRGNFTDQTLNDSLPKVMTNYLNPHIIMSGSGAQMYKLLEPSNGRERDFTPSEIVIKKSTDPYGDLLIMCTDGIYSIDEIQMGRGTNDGKIWVEGSERLHLLCKHLKEVLSIPKQEKVNLKLNEYLKLIQGKGLVDDDATLSVHISDRAYKYNSPQTNLAIEEE